MRRLVGGQCASQDVSLCARVHDDDVSDMIMMSPTSPSGDCHISMTSSTSVSDVSITPGAIAVGSHPKRLVVGFCAQVTALKVGRVQQKLRWWLCMYLGAVGVFGKPCT